MSAASTCTEAAAAGEPCFWCGEPRAVALFEVWEHGHEFVLDTCCGAALEEVCAGIAEDPAWGRDLLRRLGAEAYTGHRLRRVADDGAGALLLDYRLQIRPVTFAVARAFVARHHSHCNPPVAWRFGFGIANGGLLLGVAMACNPVARALNGRGVVEVNRLCIRRDIPRVLAWNACSTLYGRCAREAERLGFARIITYTREDEDGTSLRAAGWTPEARVRGQGWHGARRRRSDRNAHVDKVRWGKALRPKPVRPSAPPAPAPMDTVPEWMLGPGPRVPSATL